MQAHALDGLQVRKDYARGKTSGTEAAHSHFIADAWPGGYRGRHGFLRGRVRAAVLQNRGVEAILQVAVSFPAFVDGVAMLEQRGDVYLSAGEQIEEGFHVAPFRRTDVPDGVVDRASFILRVVPPRPVSARASQRLH